MDGGSLMTEQALTGGLLILSGLVFVVGGMLYAGRAMWNWPSAASPVYLRWERGFVIAAALIAALGFNLLGGQLEAAGDRLLAPSGWVIFAIATAVVIAAESFSLSRQEWFYAPVVVFVILAFLGQAAFGAALLRTGFLPGWVGWTAILWNLGWLVVLPILRPLDMYYPWLHYIAPLVIGVSLLVR